MWLYGAMQFLVNIGWAFLLTMLPVYLSDVHNVKLEDIGLMQSTPLLIASNSRLPRESLTPVGNPPWPQETRGTPRLLLLVSAAFAMHWPA